MMTCSNQHGQGYSFLPSKTLYNNKPSQQAAVIIIINSKFLLMPKGISKVAYSVVEARLNPSLCSVTFWQWQLNNNRVWASNESFQLNVKIEVQSN